MCRFVQHRLTTFCVTGMYFNFDKTSTFATDNQVLAVKQCRNGISVWSGNVKYWTVSNQAGSTGDAHGRRDSGAANDQWEICDIVTTASSCPSTTTAPTTSPTAPTSAPTAASTTNSSCYVVRKKSHTLTAGDTYMCSESEWSSDLGLGGSIVLLAAGLLIGGLFFGLWWCPYGR